VTLAVAFVTGTRVRFGAGGIARCVPSTAELDWRCRLGVYSLRLERTAGALPAAATFAACVSGPMAVAAIQTRLWLGIEFRIRRSARYSASIGGAKCDCYASWLTRRRPPSGCWFAAPLLLLGAVTALLVATFRECARYLPYVVR
jgi:hypothetical protein